MKNEDGRMDQIMAKRVEDFEEDVINQEAKTAKRQTKNGKAEAETQELTEAAKA